MEEMQEEIMVHRLTHFTVLAGCRAVCILCLVTITSSQTACNRLFRATKHFRQRRTSYKARAWVLRGWRKCVADYVQGRSAKTEPAECGGMSASFSHKDADRNFSSYKHGRSPAQVCAESGIRF